MWLTSQRSANERNVPNPRDISCSERLLQRASKASRWRRFSSEWERNVAARPLSSAPPAFSILAGLTLALGTGSPAVPNERLRLGYLESCCSAKGCNG